MTPERSAKLSLKARMQPREKGKFAPGPPKPDWEAMYAKSAELYNGEANRTIWLMRRLERAQSWQAAAENRVAIWQWISVATFLFGLMAGWAVK